MAVCEKCGLPEDLCVCTEISKESQNLRIYTHERRFKKLMTVIEGFDKAVDLKTLSRELKSKFACGGTVKNGTIELQGNHAERTRKLLEGMGYSVMDLGLQVDSPGQSR